MSKWGEHGSSLQRKNLKYAFELYGLDSRMSAKPVKFVRQVGVSAAGQPSTRTYASGLVVQGRLPPDRIATQRFGLGVILIS